MSNRLRALRESAGLKQKDLAGISGISQATISRIERDSPAPSAAVAIALARALKLSVEEIFGPELSEETPSAPHDDTGEAA